MSGFSKTRLLKSIENFFLEIGSPLPAPSSIRPRTRPKQLPRFFRYDSADQVDMSIWPAAFFSPHELVSKGNGALVVETRALISLDDVRNGMGIPIFVVSAYRDPVHNARVGGAKNSQHKLGKAFDLRTSGMDDWEKEKLVKCCQEAGFTSFGGYNNFIHVDNRDDPARWGQEWAWPESYK